MKKEMDQKLVLVIFCFTLYIIFNPINSFEDGYLRDFKMSRKYYNTKAAPYQTSDKEGRNSVIFSLHAIYI